MKKVKVRKSRLNKIEKLLYTFGGLCVIMTIVLKVFCGASEGHLNISVEKARYEVDEQLKKNESLTMKVNELTSFDNVKEIVKDMGLAYNNENIIVVDE